MDEDRSWTPGGCGTLACAPIAAADPVWPVAGAESADATIDDLTAQGYDVRINWVRGISSVPLDRCKVTAIHNPNHSAPDGTSLAAATSAGLADMPTGPG